MPETPESNVPPNLSGEEEIEETTVRIVDLRHTRSPDFKTTYTDSAGLSVNFYSISIIFGQILASANEAAVIEDRLSVTMSLEHAKALAEVLQEHVRKYEARHQQQVRSKPK